MSTVTDIATISGSSLAILSSRIAARPASRTRIGTRTRVRRAVAITTAAKAPAMAADDSAPVRTMAGGARRTARETTLAASASSTSTSTPASTLGESSDAKTTATPSSQAQAPVTGCTRRIRSSTLVPSSSASAPSTASTCTCLFAQRRASRRASSSTRVVFSIVPHGKGRTSPPEVIATCPRERRASAACPPRARRPATYGTRRQAQCAPQANRQRDRNRRRGPTRCRSPRLRPPRVPLCR